MFCLEIDYVFCIIFSFYSPYPVFLFSYQHCHSELYYKFSTFVKAKRFAFTKKKDHRERFQNSAPFSAVNLHKVNIKIQRSLSRPVLRPFLYAASYPDNRLRL